MTAAVRRWVSKRVSARTLVQLRYLFRGLRRPRWGNLRRVHPFSDHFGFERGTPIDRFYLHRFLDRHRQLITGRVLEIQSSDYTHRYGRALTATDSIDVVTTFNAQPTYLVDLAASEDVIPSSSYDCFLMPNTLNMLRDVEACMRQALRVIKPGGVILATAAGLVPLTGDVADYWHLSADGWREIAARAWPGCEVRIEQHGNSLTAVAAMLGLAVEDVARSHLVEGTADALPRDARPDSRSASRRSVSRYSCRRDASGTMPRVWPGRSLQPVNGASAS